MREISSTTLSRIQSVNKNIVPQASWWFELDRTWQIQVSNNWGHQEQTHKKYLQGGRMICINIPRQVENGTQIRTFFEEWFDQIPYWCLILDQKQICRPNMNTIEHSIHGESAVHILLEEAAYSVRARPVPGRPAQITKNNKSPTVTVQIFCCSTCTTL